MRVGLQPIVLEPYMRREKPSGYVAQRLNSWTPRGWSVIEVPSGAVATDASGRLILRLLEAEARSKALEMSAEIKVGSAFQ